ncbi:hypothetical protein [Aureimonas sp. N4]|uniref:hypothetical protein n=1 Tax=Aureimonas sp. N4 TaxID=1638165 RepID=UPI000782E2C3|nr:hypothetical protein [Aureimonas sp. N4]
MLLFPNRADKPRGAMPGASITGPAWALPLENMQRRESYLVARSVDTQAANTQFTVRINGFMPYRVIVLNGHQFSVTSSLKVTGWYDDQSYSSPDFTILKDAYPSVAFTEDLPWEAENWWDGKPLTEDIAGFTQNVIIILPLVSQAPNIRVEIFDPNNAAGYVQIQRLFIADGWQPSHNYAYGGAHAYETDTQIERAIGGAESFDRREPYRVARIAFEYLPQDEALLKGLDLCRRAGTDGEIFWIADPDNERTLVQTSFLARLRQLSAWEQVVYERANIAFELKELR